MLLYNSVESKPNHPSQGGENSDDYSFLRRIRGNVKDADPEKCKQAVEAIDERLRRRRREEAK